MPRRKRRRREDCRPHQACIEGTGGGEEREGGKIEKRKRKEEGLRWGEKKES